MKVEKKDLGKSQIELMVTLTWDEFKPHVEQGTKKVSETVKVEGFRPGKADYNTLKQKVGEMTILEEAARLAINKTIDAAIDDNIKEQEPAGQPRVDITKLAPDNDMEYKVTVAVLPSIELCDYKNAKVKVDKVEVPEAEVDKTINQLRDMKVKEELVDREVKEGDKVLVDIDMTQDKVPVEGGKSEGTAVIIGKDYFVPGFDNNLVGAKKGDVREFSLPYPADHFQKNLAGKMVDFKVTIKDVYGRTLPEVNDDFVKGFGLKNLDELKNNIKQGMEADKQQKADQKAEIEMLDKLVNDTKFGDIADILVQSETRVMISELEQTIARQGAKFEDYLNSIKKTRDELVLEMAPDAVKRVKSALLIREVASKENIKVEDKEIQAKIDELTTAYKDDEKVQKMVKEPQYKNYIANILSNQKVIAKLREWNVEK